MNTSSSPSAGPDHTADTDTDHQVASGDDVSATPETGDATAEMTAAEEAGQVAFGRGGAPDDTGHTGAGSSSG